MFYQKPIQTNHESLILLCTFLFLSGMNYNQNCVGGAIKTHEAFLYGRYEVGMRSAAGNGVVSSFFLYNVDLECNWPEENNEIDIEMTGNNETVQFTTHYPGTTQTWGYSDDYYYGFNPHEAIHDYAIEWEPGIVRWFIDGELANVQDQGFVSQLQYPMRILMNIWAAQFPSWVGEWDPSILPVQAEYEYVRYYAHTPGMGNTGTDNNFTLLWEDEFDFLDESRWSVTQFGSLGSSYCTFEGSAVELADGKLHLHLEEAMEYSQTVPVTISVDAATIDLLPTDVIYLNGTFNTWCGQCNPMSESEGIWTRTVHLLPGRHEFIFTKNFWEENGGAPLNSECDFKPCDEYLNYGVEILPGSDPLILPTVCWGECDACDVTGLQNYDLRQTRELLYITDLLGRRLNPELGQIVLYHYEGGYVEKAVYREE